MGPWLIADLLVSDVHFQLWMRYAALRNRARTQDAHDLIAYIRDDMEQLETRDF
jgi:hypothetical protein